VDFLVTIQQVNQQQILILDSLNMTQVVLLLLTQIPRNTFLTIFKFVDPGDTNTKYNLQVNSANVPAYKMSSVEALSMTKGAVDYAKNVMSLDQYRNNLLLFKCYRFCLPDSDFNRLASGLNFLTSSPQQVQVGA
jgi:hypothetical protein